MGYGQAGSSDTFLSQLAGRLKTGPKLGATTAHDGSKPALLSIQEETRDRPFSNVDRSTCRERGRA